MTECFNASLSAYEKNLIVGHGIYHSEIIISNLYYFFIIYNHYSQQLGQHPSCQAAARTICFWCVGSCPTVLARWQSGPEDGRWVHPRAQITSQGHVNQV